MDRPISGSNKTIHSWHGDPDITEMDAWRRANPELVEMYEFQPKCRLPLEGQVFIFGTGGELEPSADLTKLFYAPEEFKHVDPVSSNITYFISSCDPWRQD